MLGLLAAGEADPARPILCVVIPMLGRTSTSDPQGERRCRACMRHWNQQVRAKRRAERPQAARPMRAGPKRLPSGTRTHCPKGHPYAGENLYVDPHGHRHCRICMRHWSAEAYAKLKTAQPPKPTRGIRSTPKAVRNGSRAVGNRPKTHRRRATLMPVQPLRRTDQRLPPVEPSLPIYRKDSELTEGRT
jgi:hypothetical protein